MADNYKEQAALPFAEAEGMHQEQRMLVEQAIARAWPNDLLFEQLVRYVFSVSAKHARPISESIGELAERFHCSRATLKRRMQCAVEHGIFKRVAIKKCQGAWNLASETSIDFERLATPVHRDPTPVHCDPTPVHCDPTPVHCDPTPVHSEPPLKEIQVLAGTTGSCIAPSDVWDEDADGARYFFEDELADIRAKANTIDRWIAAKRPEDRELVLKIATLWHDRALSEDALEQVLESFQRKRDGGEQLARPLGWLWVTLRGQCAKQGLRLETLLARTDFPRELLAGRSAVHSP